MFNKISIKSNLPLVTIGVLSYNYSNYVLAALNSLLHQTYSNIELIIIDDNSTEKTPLLIDAWIKENNVTCTFIKNKENLGITKVSNNIVTLAKGKYISLFAIDDIMLPRKIEEQVKALEEAGDEYGVCYANVEKMSEDGTPLGPYIEASKFKVIEGEVIKPYALGQLSFCTPGCLIRTSVYKKIGLYDERVLYEDYNFWLRAFACVKVKYCTYPCLFYRWKATSPIYEEWSKNNKERYNRDRVLSNHQALKFIKDKEVKRFLKKKNRQYLKSLSLHKSAYVKPLVYFLISKGYIDIPLQVIVRLIIGK